jgi:hypothetical protein
MKNPAAIIRFTFLACILGLVTGCGDDEKRAAPASAEHGHSHE